MCSGASSIVSCSVRLPGIDRLAVRAVDQVQVHVVVPGGAGGGERRAHAVGRVQPFERRQHRRHRTTGRPSRGARTRRRATRAAEASSTVSGFASVVISASDATSKVSRRWVSSAARSAGVCIVGVPPPRNTLVTLRTVPRGDDERRLGHRALEGSEAPGGPGRRRR